MSTYADELKQKTDQELQELAASSDNWSAAYNEAVRAELQNRGLTVELPKDSPKLNLEQRRKICESCKNHKNEIPTNPDSPAICGLTMKNPAFNGKQCALYDPDPKYKNYLLRRGIYGLVLGVLFELFGVFRMAEIVNTTKRPEDLNMFSTMWGIFMIIAGIAMLVYSIKAFTKMIRFKYPGEK